jgi:hypothetical protein
MKAIRIIFMGTLMMSSFALSAFTPAPEKPATAVSTTPTNSWVDFNFTNGVRCVVFVQFDTNGGPYTGPTAHLYTSSNGLTLQQTTSGTYEGTAYAAATNTYYYVSVSVTGGPGNWSVTLNDAYIY